MSDRCQAETRDGSQCERPATDGDYCWQHCDKHRQDKQQKKDAFLKSLRTEAITVERAAEEAGVSRQVIYKWKEHDLAFAERYEQAKKVQEDLRADALADSAFLQCVTGAASAALFIFVLKRYGGIEWKSADRKDFKVDDTRLDPAMNDLYERNKQELEAIEGAGDE